MEPILLYLTAKDKHEAEALARALLEARLIACANLLPAAASLYRWEGEVRQSEECVLIAKSVRGRAPEIVETVKRLHSYECPCVIALPIEGGNAAFLEWVAQETAA